MTSRDLQKRQTRQAFFQSVLQLSRSGHAFSSISLRQISREVGVVPTAFYRHFQDIDELGTCLVNEELGHTLQNLRDHLQLGRTRTHEGQIASSVGFFLESVEHASLHWHFIVSERYGGNQAVQSALDEQISLFAQIMTDDLAMQPAFGHLNQEVRLLIADMGVNMYFSWVYQWLKFDPTEVQSKQDYLNRCIKQAQVLFYGVRNWCP
nr:TetR family transcriptional regulator [uncultured Moraxella sp.]